MTREDEDSLFDKVYYYSKAAHDDTGAKRKGSGDPYFVHPEGVTKILMGYGVEDQDVLDAAKMHDLVEDAGITVSDLEDISNPKAAELVSELTNSPDYDGLSKEEYMSRKLVGLTDDALTVKLGDMLYNLLDNPRLNQIERMKSNIEYLRHHRKIKRQIHRDLIEAYLSGFPSQQRKLQRVFR
jgi:(p)ppGpp synthase/HD superfamily hydrolase